jgi:pimeloyl-ACP methyl ester carboxylesterase
MEGLGWVLTSALYMDAKWATPFEAGKTQPGTFTPAGAKPVTVPFLNGAGFRNAAAGGWQTVALPYQGGKLTMTGNRLPALLGDVRHVLIHGAPHAIIWTHAAEVNQRLLDFMAAR